MKNWLITVSDLPADGREFSFADDEFWQDRLSGHGVAIELADSPLVDATVQPQSGGALVRGRLRGNVRLICDRCAEPFDFPVQAEFELFEALPNDDDPAEDSRLRLVDDALELDLGAMVWEEFILALPMKPLCRDECRGICSKCGQNLNNCQCDCARDEGDPRLAVFRDLKLK